MVYRDRADAGRVLASWLTSLAGHDPVVVGIARGGVVVASEVAAALDAPLDVLVVRKLVVRVQPEDAEIAIGAAAEGGVTATLHDVMRKHRVTAETLAAAAHREHAAVTRQAATYRRARPAVDLAGRTVVLTDDGAVSGATVRAAIRVLRARRVARIVLAVPVAPATVIDELARTVNQVVCPRALRWLPTVRGWYAQCPVVPDSEVVALLTAAKAREAEVPAISGLSAPANAGGTERS